MFVITATHARTPDGRIYWNADVQNWYYTREHATRFETMSKAQYERRYADHSTPAPVRIEHA